jgi:hypothetical protein
MTYSSGGLIQATDYNGFVEHHSGCQCQCHLEHNYGQTALATVSAAGTVTATQWASLGQHHYPWQRINPPQSLQEQHPQQAHTISVLAAVNTDITNCFTNRQCLCFWHTIHRLDRYQFKN